MARPPPCRTWLFRRRRRLRPPAGASATLLSWGPGASGRSRPGPATGPGTVRFVCRCLPCLYLLQPGRDAGGIPPVDRSPGAPHVHPRAINVRGRVVHPPPQGLPVDPQEITHLCGLQRRPLHGRHPTGLLLVERVLIFEPLHEDLSDERVPGRAVVPGQGLVQHIQGALGEPDARPLHTRTQVQFVLRRVVSGSFPGQVSSS